jgi:hypothetical protein
MPSPEEKQSEEQIQSSAAEQHAPRSPSVDRDSLAERAVKSAGKGVFRLLTAPFRSKLFLLGCIVTGLGGALIVAPTLGKQFGGMGDTLVALSPWMLRVGISFLAAFLFAFFVKRVIKLALLVGGSAVLIAIAVHKLGLGMSAEHVDMVKDTVTHATQEAQAYADGLWASIKPYLPSSGAAGVGMWRGATRKFEA